MIYQPKPLNTSGIELKAEIVELQEKLAENIHEVWAFNRMQEGWMYGDIRDEIKKEHPCLVPYHELPESEKQYDRNTAMETLKTIVLLGYEIRKRK